MRENRPYGSEGGGAEFNQPFLPLSQNEEHWLPEDCQPVAQN